MRMPWICAATFAAIVTWTGSALSFAIVAADDTSPEKVLRTKGLVQRGDVWIVLEEMQLRRRLETLPAARRDYFAARRSMRQLRDTLTTLRAQAQETRTVIDQAARQRLRSGLSPLVVQSLEKRLTELRRQASEQAQKLRRLDAADETSEFSKAALQLHTARSDLMNQLLWCRHLLEARGNRYESLHSDPQTMQAISTLNGVARLGPIDPSDDIDRRLTRIEEEVLTGPVPLIQRGTRFRFAAMLGDVAATFSYSGPEGESVVPPSLLKSARIEVPQDAEHVTVQIDQRRIPARRIKLDSVRVGIHVLRDVPALAVGPEGEDLGARLGGAAFQGYRVELDGPRLMLRLTPD